MLDGNFGYTGFGEGGIAGHDYPHGAPLGEIPPDANKGVYTKGFMGNYNPPPPRKVKPRRIQ